MSWKKTLDNPDKIMEYRRPLFIASVFLSNWTAMELQSNPVDFYTRAMGSWSQALTAALPFANAKKIDLSKLTSFNIDKSDNSTNEGSADEEPAPNTKKKKKKKSVLKTIGKLVGL